MSKQVHLFNCDSTYKLDAVEDLLNATKAKLSFVPVVEKHYFSLSEMSEMTTNIKQKHKLQMDMAFFVVHAHESRLSINEDNAGIGYANIYRALMEATGGEVIIIIGGDDNYKNEDEEDRVVISRWAKRKILSQFSDEFLDGSKSFIFSWNKKHREIHEEALLHYFDSSKKGQKFEYQPKPRQPGSVQSVKTTSERTLSGTYHSTDEQRGREGIGSSSYSNAAQKTHGFASSPSNSADQTSEHSDSDHSKDAKPREVSHPSRSDHRGDDNLFSHPSSTEQNLFTEKERERRIFSDSRNADQRRDGPSPSNLGYDTSRVNKEPVHDEQRALPTKTEDLAILCCNLSEDSMHAVMQVLLAIAPSLNLSANPPVENSPPDKITGYLTEVPLKVCVLVVDGKTVKDAYEKLPQQKEKYGVLLETAANRVVEKFIILICDNCSLSLKDEEIVNRTIEDIKNETGKPDFTAWLKNGKLCMDPNDFAQVIMSSLFANQGNPKSMLPRGSRTAIGASGSVGDYTRSLLKRDVKNAPGNATANTSGQRVLLKSKLRHGMISSQPNDREIWCPNFKVPDDITANLREKYRDYPMVGVKIINNSGELRWFVELKSKGEEGIEIADNETLKFRARIRHGKISIAETDQKFIYPNWQVPDEIVESLERRYWNKPDGELYVISDEEGKLRDKVHFGTKENFAGFFNRVLHRKQ